MTTAGVAPSLVAETVRAGETAPVPAAVKVWVATAYGRSPVVAIRSTASQTRTSTVAEEPSVATALGGVQVRSVPMMCPESATVRPWGSVMMTCQLTSPVAVQTMGGVVSSEVAPGEVIVTVGLATRRIWAHELNAE
jgi:hypothetical protein